MKALSLWRRLALALPVIAMFAGLFSPAATADTATPRGEGELTRAAEINPPEITPMVNCGVLAPGAAVAAQNAVIQACNQIGVNYSWSGGHGSAPGPSYGICDPQAGAPNDCHVYGLDCSGLTRYAYYLAVGADIINGNTRTQWNSSRAVARFTRADGDAPLLPGDLLFYSNNGYASGIHHVTIYLGRGWEVEAPYSGATVRVHNHSNYRDYYGAVRLYNPAPPPDYSADAPAAVVSDTGAMQVFGRDERGGGLVTSWQSAKGSLWSGWTGIGLDARGTPAARIDIHGQKDVLFRRADGHLIEVWQDGPLGPMNKFADLGGDFAGDPALLTKADGSKVVFVRGTDGQLWHKWQNGPDSSMSVSALVRPDLGQVTGKPSVFLDGQGRMVVFVTRADGHLITTWQSAPGSTFDMLADLGGDFAGDPAAIRKPDGTMIVFIRGADGQLWNKWQDVPGGAFGLSALVRGDLGGIAGKPAAIAYADGSMQVFARRVDGHLVTAWQLTPGQSFDGFDDIGGSLAADPAIVTGIDGVKVAYARFTDGSILTTWQDGPLGPFPFLNTP